MQNNPAEAHSAGLFLPMSKDSPFVRMTKGERRYIIFPEVGEMDQREIGKFIAALRRREGLTQEELGGKLGVTNKTISRWENGNYMPDITMLKTLSEVLNVSINELLSGRFLEEGEIKEHAEKNITDVSELTGGSAFSNHEKLAFFKKKWLQEHMAAIVLAWACFIVLALYAFANAKPLLAACTPLIGGGLYAYINNKMCAYAEKNTYL